MMRRAGQALANLLFPPARCLGCDEPRDKEEGAPLCPACKKELESLRVPEQVCGNCLSPLRGAAACSFCAQGGMRGMEQAFAPYVYKDLARKLILQLKFLPVELAAVPLAHEMALAISGIRFDALVPVPLYKTRQRERGMNQSLMLCGLIAEQTGFPVVEALRKTRRIKRQSSLPAARRLENVKGAIAAARRVDGQRILLVDDVRTTGATARECAQTLLEAGAASVCLLTAAVAYAGGSHGHAET